MRSRTTRHATSAAVRSMELGFAVPLVVAHRLARMANAGHSPTARDRKEFGRMVAEKQAAFVQSWWAMAMQSALVYPTIVTALLRSFWSIGPRSFAPAAVAAQLQRAAFGVFNKGLAPVHRKATANAKRLTRTRHRRPL